MKNSNSKSDVAATLSELSPFVFYEYASYVPGRTNGSVKFEAHDYKRHLTLAHAKSAIKNSRFVGVDPSECKIYRFDTTTNGWHEVD